MPLATSLDKPHEFVAGKRPRKEPCSGRLPLSLWRNSFFTATASHHLEANGPKRNRVAASRRSLHHGEDRLSPAREEPPPDGRRMRSQDVGARDAQAVVLPLSLRSRVS